MKKSRHKPPSRIRYEKNNPVVSFRTKKEWYNEFKAFLEEQGWNIGDFFRVAFKKQKTNYIEAHRLGYNKGHKEGYKEGYEKGKKDWRIWLFCKTCEDMII